MADQKQTTALALNAAVNEALPTLAELAPPYVNVRRMAALAIEAIGKNPLLASCTPISVVAFMKRCAECGTDRIGAGGMWAVPFKDGSTGKYNVVAMPDWRLLIEKAKKAGAIVHCNGQVVHEKDVFEYQQGDIPRIHHVPYLGKDPGEIIGVYAIATLPGGEKHIEWMSKADVEAIRKRSKAANSGPWVTDWPQMAIKTVIRRDLKPFEGASIELTRALDTDNAFFGMEDLPPRPPVAMPVLTIDTTATPLPEPVRPAEKSPATVVDEKAAERAAKLQALFEDLATEFDGDVEFINNFVKHACGDACPDFETLKTTTGAAKKVREALAAMRAAKKPTEDAEAEE